MVRQIEEAGRTPGIDLAEALALALGLSPCHLAYGAPVESTATGLESSGIGRRLLAARELRGLSRNGLGKAAGLSHTAIGVIEAGKVMPGVDTAEDLADVLRLSVCWLAYGEGDMEPLQGQRGARRPSSSRAI